MLGNGSNSCKRAEIIRNKSQFADKLSSFDPRLSLKMLLLSAVAYDSRDPEECLKNSLLSDKFRLQIVVTKTCDRFKSNCSGHNAVSHTLEVRVVAFLGSGDLDQAFTQFLVSLLSSKTPFLNYTVESS